MSTRLRYLASLATCTIGSACAGSAEPEIALLNAKVFTADSATPWAEAVLIRGDRIAAVGTEGQVLAAAGSAVTRVDLGGRTVVPGFNDAHDHVSPPAPGVIFATVSDPVPEPSFGLVLDSLRVVVSRTAPGTWLRTTVGSIVLGDRAARRSALDRVAPDHPVELRAWSGHGIIVNTVGLRALGIAEAASDPLGGAYERDEAGRMTGLLEEYAGYNVWPQSVEQGPEAIVTAFRSRGAEVVAWGITSVQNMMSGMDPSEVAAVLDTLDLSVRLRLMKMPLTTPSGRDLGPWSALVANPASGVTVHGTKWVLDGTPVEALAALKQPYADLPGWFGRLNFPPDTLLEMLQEAVAADEQILLHAVGDSTVALALSLMEEVAPDSVWRRLRPRLEHGEGLGPDQFARAKRLGVVVVQNPSHFALGPLAAARYGPDRMQTLQPMRSYVGAGIPVALGSDGPLNPFLNLMLAVIHPNNPAEALTLGQAVVAYTAGSAYAEHAETEKGRLKIGLVADLAVLSQDIFTVAPQSLPATTSLLTLIGGVPVHDPSGLWPRP